MACQTAQHRGSAGEKTRVNAIRQMVAVSLLNLRSIPQRLASSLVVVVGMAAVVAVVVSVLAMSGGFLESVHKTGRADRAIVTSSGAVTESLSILSRDTYRAILDAPGVLRDSDGRPIASADLFAYQPVTKKADGLFIYATLHGVGPQLPHLLPQIRLVSGRMFAPGSAELIVGRMMESQLNGLDVGSSIRLPQGDWKIVGSFVSDGDQHESELLGDAETLLSSLRRSGFNSATVMLSSADAFAQFKNSLTANPALSVDVHRESAYFAKLAKPLNDFLTLVAYVVGGIMGLGAVFGALNTMYAAVAARGAELATLRAIGFGGMVVATSVLAEALLLTLVGAALGVLCTWALFSGRIVVSDYYIYSLVVTPRLAASGVALAALAGIIGGMFPAIRAARAPITAAIRGL
jgi:putative ABC transport system permease protein